MEYYPTLKAILELLGEDCILVGSATRNDPLECKDYDFVINAVGWYKLKDFEYYLYSEDINWKQYIPLSSKDKWVDFFHGLCNITDIEKHSQRITFEQAEQLPLKIVEINVVSVLSI